MSWALVDFAPWRGRKTQNLSACGAHDLAFRRFWPLVWPWNQRYSACGAHDLEVLDSFGPWRAREIKQSTACGALAIALRGFGPCRDRETKYVPACHVLALVAGVFDISRPWRGLEASHPLRCAAWSGREVRRLLRLTKSISSTSEKLRIWLP